ncbi:MAG TPA: chemotaxis protein CheW [Spirochaetota bacterium]|nr:chemotaxis protein CheW [Spirochaetota bacterium]HNT12014.1 chemotaxis protein CheW [Spirochaetota bacterium]HNV48862.1 chemotaxis protein CheW [Spirochaetota bacterium]HOS40036.1 chemotaxis protein CheW [Spirochaetota bacterium]HPU88004.1 chemotaxis protein CheW [Spirochaetota bacterium]
MKKAESVASSLQVVCFKVGREEYGIDILKVQEILKVPKITVLPKSAEYIKGVIDLRGKVIPIIDLGKRFGIEMGGDLRSSRVIVVDVKGKRIGLAIDAVSHVAKIDAKDIEPPPPVVKGISGRYIAGIGKLGQDFVVILDIDQIFMIEELKNL